MAKQAAREAPRRARDRLPVWLLDLVLPLLVGAVADGPGLFAAMLVLLAQPLGVLLAAAAAHRGERVIARHG